VVPILTGLWYRQFGKGKAEQVEPESGLADEAGHSLLVRPAPGGHF
jgi:hypothetical protein